MAIYTAPIDDMMFLFEKLRDNSHYNELEKYKEVNPDLAKDILEQAAKITENLILPLAKTGDKTQDRRRGNPKKQDFWSALSRLKKKHALKRDKT